MRKIAKYSMLAIASFAWSMGAQAATDRETLRWEMQHKLLGDSHQSTLQDTDPDFASIRDRLIYGDILQNVKLDKKLSELISLAAITAAGATSYIGDHVKAALSLGESPLRIKEALYQVAPYAGLPKVEAALVEANKVFKAQGIKLPLESTATVKDEERFEKGRDLQVKTYGERITNMHKNALDDEKYLNVYLLSSYCFGDFYTREGLNMKEREILTFSVIAVIGGAEGQLTGHTIASFSEGNTKRDLVDAITLCLPYMGFPRSLNALAIVKKVEAQLKESK